ncbi:MAG: hypothetical protein WCI67_21755 [Chloroflexales bacterium]
MAAPIRLQHEFVAAVAVAEDDHRLDDLALRAIEHAAVVAALQISHQRALAALEAASVSAAMAGLRATHGQSIAARGIPCPRWRRIV